jgi:hypothetical protein
VTTDAPRKPRTGPQGPEHEFLDEEMKKACEAGAIAEVTDLPKNVLTCPLHVNTTGKKWRLVMDARAANAALPPPPEFRLPKLKDFLARLVPGMWITVSDLKSGYHQLPLGKQLQPYALVEWSSKIWAFQVVPFGATHAPWAFNRCTSAVADHWVAKIREQTTKPMEIMAYVDDFVIAGMEEDIVRISETANQSARRLGMWFSPRKTQPWGESVEVLGFHVDTRNGRVKLTDAKRGKLLTLIEKAKRGQSISKPEIDSLAGTLAATRTACPAAGLLLRNIYAEKPPTTLSKESKEDLEVWEGIVQENAGTTLPAWIPPATIRIESDAAKSTFRAGGGFWIKGITDPPIARAWRWTPEEASGTIFELEGLAVVRALQEVIKEIPGQGAHVKIMCDNQNVVHAIQSWKGARSTRLQAIARRIWLLATEGNLRLDVEWLASEKNSMADFLSRDGTRHGMHEAMMTKNAWIRTAQTCIERQLPWPPTMDVAATPLSTRAPKYIAPTEAFRNQPGCVGVDLFEAWTGKVIDRTDIIWAFIAPHQALRLMKWIQKLQKTQPNALGKATYITVMGNRMLTRIRSLLTTKGWTTDWINSTKPEEMWTPTGDRPVSWAHTMCLRRK